MDEAQLIAKIRGTDWAEYVGPDCYEPQAVTPALTQLATLTALRPKAGCDYTVLSAIGNNHRGTYYPALLTAVDLIIEIAVKGNFEASKKCASAVLFELNCFEPEIGAYTGCTNAELRDFVEPRIRPFDE